MRSEPSEYHKLYQENLRLRAENAQVRAQLGEIEQERDNAVKASEAAAAPRRYQHKWPFDGPEFADFPFPLPNEGN